MSNFTRTHRPLYRVYHLKRDGGIARADIIEAIDDEDAIECLRALADNHAVELWDRARFVAKAEPPLGAMTPEPVLIRGEPAVDALVTDALEDEATPKVIH